MGPDEPGFHEHYLAARAGKVLETKKPEQPKKGTLDELFDRYLAWLEKQVKAGINSPKTLTGRRTGLKQACETLDPDGIAWAPWTPICPKTPSSISKMVLVPS
ncbi:hypothetical protein [Roseovarius sp. D22-M7]|uniref:hypothetical protein n=1 Tax=Roseovarius sp. D22-M7 TaxID=3127116 RepID=UPI00300F9569